MLHDPPSSLTLRAGAAFAVLLALWLLAYPLHLRVEGVWLQSDEALACFLVVSASLGVPLLVAARRAWTEAGRLAAPPRRAAP